ncbi:phage regulatory CII family protein [Nitratidesulfovibrio liaohensis]|uniref:Uncharacterized protein n=1 Tax=Nitratidesulfovibrio liaohensis TaxID=2604158 RepID=A0ABY9R4G5_9BACT|nr:phage regulatory CII family protein [Nitratidesulfovibrio liaohensis]WMW66624.1 hypothetical protein KPS_001226 [Nitratidesulfovibrio liaohensis]
MRQGSLFDGQTPRLAGAAASVRAAMNHAAGEYPAGRKQLVDRINEIARRDNLRLTGGNVRTISKDTLDKMLSPGDQTHKPSVDAMLAVVAATGDYGPLEALLEPFGLKILTPEKERDARFGRAVREEKEARKRRKQLEDL